MVGQPLIKNPGEPDYDILHLSSYRQPQDSQECILYSLWMSAQYIANEYPSEEVRNKIEPPKLDLINEYIEIGSLGWENVGQDPLTELSSETSGIKFDLDYHYNGFPQRVDSFVEDSLDQLLPTILFVDKAMLDTGDRGQGPLHAVVVCGAGESHITIEDPLVEGTTTLEIERLEEAWDPEYNTAIEVQLRDNLGTVRRNQI